MVNNCTACFREGHPVFKGNLSLHQMHIFEGRGLCLNKCPLGMFNISINLCAHCHNSCLQCEGISTKCTKCTGNTFLFENACVAVCPAEYYYPDPRLAQCTSMNVYVLYVIYYMLYIIYYIYMHNIYYI